MYGSGHCSSSEKVLDSEVEFSDARLKKQITWKLDRKLSLANLEDHHVAWKKSLLLSVREKKLLITFS